MKEFTNTQKALFKVIEYKFACEDYGLSTFNKYKGFITKSQFEKLPKLSAVEKWFFEMIQKENKDALADFYVKMEETKQFFKQDN